VSSDQVQEQQNEKARKKRRGLWLTLGLLSFLFLAVPAVCYMFFSMRAARLVKAELTAIRADGLPATPEELNDYYKYPPVDKDATRLWLAAVRQFGYQNPEYREARDELPILGRSEVRFGPDEDVIPPPGEEWEDLEETEAFLAKYADSIALMYKAVEKGGAARYPIDFTLGSDAQEYDMHNLCSAEEVLSLQAHVLAHRKYAHGTAESIHAIFVLGQSLDKEPLHFSQWLRMAINNRACYLLLELLPYVEFSHEDIALLREDLQSIDHDAALELAIIGERAWAVGVFRDPALYTEFEDMPLYDILATLGSRNDDLSLCLMFMKKYLAAARSPLPQRLDAFEAVNNEKEAVMDSVVNRIRYLMSHWTLYFYPKFFADCEASSLAADAALAVELFSRKNGRLPDELDELVPEFMEEVPLDPFDGKPLRYTVREEEYVIYSVGRDRVDDGGEIIEEVDEYGEYVGPNPDLVFPIKRVE